MKKKLNLTLLALATAFSLKISTTDAQLNTGGTNYVVVGAFSIQKNARKFSNMVRQSNPAVEFSVNPSRNLFYVYVLTTQDHEMALDEVRKLRAGSYPDAWVFRGALANEQPIKISHATKPDVTEPEKNKPVPTDSSEGLKLIATPATSLKEAEPGSKRFVFKITTSDQNEIQGDVDLMDLDKTTPRKMASYKGNEEVDIKPINKSGNIAFVCEVFGYRKIQTVINFNQPDTTEGIRIEADKLIVPFELVRLKKGDIAVMYNVYFYKDAGIMRPESKFEVNTLMQMLKENPNQRIRIHGHTNGNAAGKVISVGKSKDFFTITGDVKEGFGSAKKLSEERALVIQNYLISQGIDAKRMEIKAWGGKKPIYEADHPLARSNVRVEIEILED
jgi:outer membrane protein OmpA-like peptidoglycan-associated protein